MAMPENAPQQIEESDRRTRRGLLVAVMAGGLAAAAVPVLWYGYHENRTPGGRVSWRLASDETAWAEYAVPEKAAEILGADSIEAKTRPLGPTGAQAYALVVRWSGVAENALASEYHDPSICLPAAGMGVALAAEPFSVDVDGVKIDFSQGRFTSKEGGQHVFYCHWDAWLGRARGAQGEAEDDVTGWRWGRVKMGRRHGDVAYLAFVVPLGDEREAQAWLREWAPRLLRRT